MFESYENLNPAYVPNNKIVGSSESQILMTHSLRKQYNAKGEFVAWEWDYGDTCSIYFPVNPTILVEENALIFAHTGETPTTSTPGGFGQRAYNTVDKICWVCETLDTTVYNWVQQDEFIYPTNGTKPINIINQDTNDIEITLQILDNRYQCVYTKTELNSLSITLDIDENLSAQLIPDTYYCYVDYKVPGTSQRVSLERILLTVKSAKGGSLS